MFSISPKQGCSQNHKHRDRDRDPDSIIFLNQDPDRDQQISRPKNSRPRSKN